MCKFTSISLILTCLSLPMAANASDLAAFDDEIAWRLMQGIPEYCPSAAEVLKKPRFETRPYERYNASLTMRRCNRLAMTQEIAASTSDAALISLRYDIQLDTLSLVIQKEKNETDFQGIKFGVGVGVSFSGDDVISTAEIGAGNIVRATKDESTQPRVILESHYYGLCKTKACNAGRFGIGPYFGIVAKDDKLISAFSAGVMLGWKDSRDETSSGFSVGIGALLDSDVSSLADGFVDGQPLPTGEIAVRFKTESRWSGIIFFTRTF